MRVLVLSSAIPFPPVSGGKLRTCHLLRALARHHEITLIGFTYGEEPGSPPFPVRVVAVPWESPPLYRQMNEGGVADAQRAADQLSREDHEPWCVSWAESAALETALESLVQERFDLILLAGTTMARFLPALPSETPKILDFPDVYTRMALRQVQEKHGAAGEVATGEAERTRRFERQAALKCEVCLAVSQEEALGVQRLLEINHIHVVPNGVDTSLFMPSSDPSEEGYLLFTGAMSYRPNSEAVQHFVPNIWPLILQEIPEAIFHVVGDGPPQGVTSLASRNVVVHGRVPDIRPYHRRASVVVAPLLRGGGTKLKVLEAAASGKAIVTTSVGVEGLAFRDGEDLIVADAAADFARAVVSLAKDPIRRRQLGKRARQVALQYDWEAIGDRLCQIVESEIKAGGRLVQSAVNRPKVDSAAISPAPRAV